MFVHTVKWAGMAALVCGLAFAGVGVMARQDAEATKDEGAGGREARGGAPKSKRGSQYLPRISPRRLPLRRKARGPAQGSPHCGREGMGPGIQ